MNSNVFPIAIWSTENVPYVDESKVNPAIASDNRAMQWYEACENSTTHDQMTKLGEDLEKFTQELEQGFEERELTQNGWYEVCENSTTHDQMTKLGEDLEKFTQELGRRFEERELTQNEIQSIINCLAMIGHISTDPTSSNENEDTTAHMFSVYSNVQSHQVNQFKEQSYKCEEFDETLDKSFNLKACLKTCASESLKTNSYQCKYCGKKYKRNSVLKLHMKIHTVESPNEVEECNQRFNTDSYQKIETAVPIITDIGVPFESKNCVAKFTSDGNLKVHLKVHANEKPYECKECDRKYTHKKSLKAHLRVHSNEKPYKCKDCGKNFVRSTSLWRHRRTHTNEKPHECQECGKKFTEKGNLKQHMRIHSNEKPYECKICGERFAWHKTFQKHGRAQHSNEKPYEANSQLKRDLPMPILGKGPYECTLCDKTFTLRNSLRVHLTTHSDEKLYECKECGKSFKLESYLNSHQRIHSIEKPYECKECGIIFVWHDTFINHQIMHANKKVFECKEYGEKFT